MHAAYINLFRFVYPHAHTYIILVATVHASPNAYISKA